MIAQGWRNQRRQDQPAPAPAAAPLQLKRVSTRPQAKGGFFDSMLGQGSSRTVESAVDRFRRADAGSVSSVSSRATGSVGAELARPSSSRSVPAKTLRMQAVGSEPAAAPKPRGYLRLALACAALTGVALKFKPWQAASSIKVADLVHLEKAPEPEPEAKLPLADAGGDAVALWHAASGQWYGVNSKAQLSRMPEAEAQSKLKLPHLEGAALQTIEKHGSRILALDIDPQELAELLPLRDDLATECEAIVFQGRQVRLRLGSGTVADLGEGAFKARQGQLALVLADLGARKKRPTSVDLRFENTAVVRLASR